MIGDSDDLATRSEQRQKSKRVRTKPEAHVAALVGSALTFSDQMLRVLNMEFAEISFQRHSDPEDIFEGGVRPHVVILDYAASDDALELVQRIQLALPGASVALAYRSIEQAPELADPARVGAISPPVSLLPINGSLDFWLSVIRLLLCGEEYIPREIIHAWHMSGPLPRPVPLGERRTVRRTSGQEVNLTAREREILPLIAQGEQNKAIANVLGLSEHTVKLHTHNILQKLGVSNRTSAADWYRSHGQDHVRGS